MGLNPILILEDDKDDRDMIKEAWEKLGSPRPIEFFKSGPELEKYLKGVTLAPFIILSDVNLQGESGFEIKKRIADDPDMKYKSVPLVFWSTNASERQVQYAYDLPVQGFFIKPSNFDDLVKTFNTILEYWQQSQHPKRVQ